MWRILYAGVGGYETASWFEYITFKTSGPGDVPSFCIPLALSIFELKRKLKTRDEDSYHKVCSKRSCNLVLVNFGLFTVWSFIWGYLYITCKDSKFSTSPVNTGTGISVALFIIPFTILGVMLNNQERES